jgi:hypothetical protein
MINHRRAPVILEKCNWEDVKPYSSRGCKDHVSMKPSLTTEWYWVRNEAGTVLGIGAILWLKNGGARLKSVWVPTVGRHQGVGGFITDERIKIIKAAGCSFIEAWENNPKYLFAKGFKEIGRLPNGAVRVIKAI